MCKMSKMSNKDKLQRRRSSEPLSLGLGTTEQPALSGGFERFDRIGQSAGSESPTAPKTAGRIAAAVAYLRHPAHWWVAGLIVLVSFGVFGKGLNYLEESARQQTAERAVSANTANGESQSWLNAINPFIEPPPPPAALQLSKEYIYAGSRMLAVEDAAANAAPPADLAVWRPSNGYWYVLGGTGSAQTYAQWGQAGDIPVQGDYDGDGKTDFSVFRAADHAFYIQRSSDQGFSGVSLGTGGDKPAAADFDGDGKTDAAVFRPSTGKWYIQQSSAGYAEMTYGAGNDEPAPADFDGDGKADMTVWRASDRTFYFQRSSDSAYSGIKVDTGSGGVAAPGDYDGDGVADAAFVDGGNWTIRYSSSGQTQTIPWQAGIVVQNDYDGDGKVDIAAWRSSDGNWFIRQSSLGGQLRQVQWGAPNDIPVPAFYRR